MYWGSEKASDSSGGRGIWLTEDVWLEAADTDGMGRRARWVAKVE